MGWAARKRTSGPADKRRALACPASATRISKVVCRGYSPFVFACTFVLDALLRRGTVAPGSRRRPRCGPMRSTSSRSTSTATPGRIWRSAWSASRRKAGRSASGCCGRRGSGPDRERRRAPRRRQRGRGTLRCHALRSPGGRVRRAEPHGARRGAPFQHAGRAHHRRAERGLACGHAPQRRLARAAWPLIKHALVRDEHARVHLDEDPPSSDSATARAAAMANVAK